MGGGKFWLKKGRFTRGITYSRALAGSRVNQRARSAQLELKSRSSSTSSSKATVDNLCNMLWPDPENLSAMETFENICVTRDRAHWRFVVKFECEHTVDEYVIGGTSTNMMRPDLKNLSGARWKLLRLCFDQKIFASRVIEYIDKSRYLSRAA